MLRGASTLPHSQQAQGFTQSQEPEQEFTLLPLLTMSAQKKNFMHSKTVKCTPTNYRTQNNRRARDTQPKKIYGSQKELRLQKLHIVQASIQDPNMNLTQ